MKPSSWIMKGLPGLFAGAANALGIMAVLGLACHNAGDPRSLSGQGIMWGAVFIWALEASFCFFVQYAWQGWAIFGGSALFFWSLFLCLTWWGL